MLYLIVVFWWVFVAFSGYELVSQIQRGDIGPSFIQFQVVYGRDIVKYCA